MKIEHRSLDDITGLKLIDFELRTGEASCVECSDELVLFFENGKEISVYLNAAESTIMVEGD